MSPEERQLLSGLFDRIRESAAAPRDRDVESFILDQVRAQPYAPYLLAQAVLVQEHALNAAAERLQQLEAQVKELESRAASPQQPESGSFLGGIGKSLFGAEAPRRSSVPSAGGVSSAWTTREPVAAEPPQLVPLPASEQRGGYDPFRRGGAQPSGFGPQPGQPQPGPWAGQPQPQQGGGFLKSAMGVAAGVAGGVLLGNAIGGLMGGAKSPFGAMGDHAAKPSAGGDAASASQSGGSGAPWDKPAPASTPVAHQDEGSFSDNASYQNASYEEDDESDFGGDDGMDI